MVCESYKVSVPGSLMLCGEHAVLHGKQAVVVAINHYLVVVLTPRSDHNIQIISSEFDEYITNLKKFTVAKPYEYVLLAIEQYLPKIKQGFTLDIKSNFLSNLGFGSSAAVTVAVLGVLWQWLIGQQFDLISLYQQAVNVVRKAQNGIGSGADVAASVFGGVLAYQMQPFKYEKLEVDLPLFAVYSGSKVATPQVVDLVNRRSACFPGVFQRLYDTIDCCTGETIAAIKQGDLLRLGDLLNIQYGLQESLGVSNTVMGGLISTLRAMQDYKSVYGAKISGAGLGDCVIGLGKIAANMFPMDAEQKCLGIRQFAIEISSNGLECL